MENLNIEKFNPTKAEIATLVSKYKELVITGVDDKKGYEAVHKARMELKNVRVNISKTGKSMREEAIAFQKNVITKERELIEMVEPTERDLEAKQKTIDEEKEKINRQKFLPDRKEKLQAINVVVDDEFLLLMDDARFFQFFNQKNSEYLEAKEIEIQRKMQEEQEKLEVEKRKMQEEKEAQDLAIRAEQEKLEVEKRKIQEEKEAHEREIKRQLELEEARKQSAEKAILEAEIKAKQEADQKAKEEQDRIATEKAEQERLEKQKKYKDFLIKNSYKDSNKDDFFIQRDATKIILYKKVDELIV